MDGADFVLLPDGFLADRFADILFFRLPTDQRAGVGNGRRRKAVSAHGSGLHRPVVDGHFVAIRIDHVPRRLVDFRFDRPFVVNIFQFLGEVRAAGHFLSGAVTRSGARPRHVLTVICEIVIGRIKMLPSWNGRRDWPSRFGSDKGILELISETESRIRQDQP